MDEILRSHQPTIAVAVAGMGGLGKTELVVQYVTRHLADYPGGVCWLNGRVGDFAGQIVQIAVLELGLEVPQEDRGRPTTVEEQVQWCWRHWVPTGQVLVVLDDVATWEVCASIVPREPQFRVVMTTRERDLARQFRAIALEVLELGKARDLLGRLERCKRVERDPAGAEVLCELVGRLPLGIELVGRYLANDRYLTLGEMAERLWQKGLSDPSMEKPLNAEMTAQRGAKAAFELTWERLDAPARRMARLLGYFALDEILWALAEEMMQRVEGEEYSIRAVQTQLDNRSLVQVEPERLEVCRLHPLIRQFVQEKERAMAAESGDLALQAAFVARLLEIAQEIPQNPPSALMRQVEGVKSHLQEVAERWTDGLEGDDLLWVFVGLARFYEGQGLYAQAETWNEKCLETTEPRYDGDHPTVATSLNNLAELYRSQGRYSEAEPRYLQSLEMRQRLFEGDHPDVAASLNNLALLYHSQGRYSKAEPRYLQSLEMYQRLFEGDHPDVATSLNNLAFLYYYQEHFQESESFLLQALAMYQRVLGDQHPNTRSTLQSLQFLRQQIASLGQPEE